jgi:tetratricopeptide (TPR) repeat protein
MKRPWVLPSWWGIFCLLMGLILFAPAWGVEPAKKAEPAKKDEAVAAARKLFLQGKYDEAREAYETLTDKQPVVAALGLAHCMTSVGETEDAVKTLTTALARHADSANLHAELARLAFERGDYPAAQTSVAAALKLSPDHLLARWIQAELFRTAGKLREADVAYKWFVDYYNSHEIKDADQLRLVGLAAAQFARWNRLADQFNFLVNDLYPEILELEPAYWPAVYESGLLYLEKYNKADASRDLKAALVLNPKAAEVHAALAALALQGYELDAARRELDVALEVNPKLIDALCYRGDSHLANFQAADAIKVLEEARKLNPVREETLGRLAASYAVVDGVREDPKGTRYGKLIDEAVARNEHAGEFFHALAGGLDQCRKFPTAAKYFREAVERMPQLVAPRGELGMTYMRLGEEVEARKHLDESFAMDPFNVRVSNTLKVLEVLDGYAILETEHFILKFDRGQDELLARYASRYLEEEVYPELCQHFGFEPKGKSLFELFNKARNTNGHGWFSARMVGLPYVGTVGACAGKMVALASPNDMPQKYNWARVLKHEFVHVLNLQQTDFNIPHWFTEALAVESEGYPRPQVWNQLLAERVPKGDLLDLETINLGFIRPKSSLDWQMAYCQAQLYAQYMKSKYGKDSTAKMLTAYADNLTTREALMRSFQVKQEDFEKGYLEFVKEIVAGLSVQAKPAEMTQAELQRAQEADPDDPDLQARLAATLLARKDYPAARKLAQKAVKTEPKHQLANYVLANIHLVVGDDEEAMKLLEACLDRKAPDEKVLSLLATMKFKEKKYDEAAELYELAAKNEPQNSAWTKGLARIYLTTKDNAKLAPVLARLASLDADDRAIRKKLAQLALADKDFDAASRWANQSLQIDVMDPDSHRMLAEALVGRQDYPRAVEEYEAVVQLDPKQTAARFALAEACVHAKRTDKARATLEKLIDLEPEYPGAKELLESLK